MEKFSLKNKSTCDVCSIALNPLMSPVQTSESITPCRSFECRSIVEKRSSMTPYAFECYFKFHRARIQKRQLLISEEKQRIDALTAKHEAENQVIKAKIISTHPSLKPDDIYLIEIPTGLQRSSRLEGERLKRYTVFLCDLIQQAAQYDGENDVTFDDQLELHAKRKVVERRLKRLPHEKHVSEALCGMCKGGCCTQGKDTAYLSVLTIRRYMDAHPNQTSKDVLNSYLSRLSETPITNSCINQTDKGCGLPRDMRSDLCNGYFCESIVAYQKQAESRTSSPAVLAIQRVNTNWNRLEAGVETHVVDEKLFIAKAEY